MLAPKHTHWLRDLLAHGDVGAVMLQVDAGAGPVVGADRLRAGGDLDAAFVFGKRLGREGFQSRVTMAHHAAQVTHGV
jgi:hypothetical protein